MRLPGYARPVDTSPAQTARDAGLRYVSGLHISEPTASRSAMKPSWHAFARLPYRRPIRRFGFVRIRSGISRPPASTRAGASNTGITRAGAKCAMQAIASSDVNAYIRTISGGDFTAKDFRTWAGTVQCGQKIRGKPANGLLPEERFVVRFLTRRANRGVTASRITTTSARARRRDARCKTRSARGT